MHTPQSNQHAFTLIELLALLAVVFVFTISLLLMTGTPTCKNTRDVLAQANLRALNIGSSNFAGDHNDHIFALTSATQAQDILHKATGQRIELTQAHETILRLRYSHLVLLDYLTDRQPEPIAASPYDKKLINWQENPLAYLAPDSNFPYSQGLPTKPGYDMDPIWTDPAILQLWPFASSYQVIPNAWLDDTTPQTTPQTTPRFTPSPTSPHHMIPSTNAQGEQTATPIAGRKLSEVKYPSNKVFMYEEFDYSSERSPLYVSDPNAKANLAFFDGSVRQEKTAAANSAFDPANPTAIWQQPYLPLDTFPLPTGGLNDQTKLDLRFRWTKNGLAGIDYP